MPGSSPQLDARWAANRSLHGGVDEIPLPAGANGRLWLCGKYFIAPDPEAAMAYVAATAVVCLNEPHDLERYPGYLEWLQEQPPDRVLWWPIPDLHVPDRDSALGRLGDLRALLADGQTLLMHCGAGIGRAGTIAAALLITMGAEPADAITRVRASRPMAGPEAGPQSEFLQWLAGQTEKIAE